MTDTNNNNRLPLFVALLGAFLLLGIGGYLLWNKERAPATEGSADSASADADTALAAAGMDANDRKATEAIVRAYILANPDIITQAVEILQQRDIAKRLAAVGDKLRLPFPGAVAGNASGDVTLVEFTDYNCGFCRSSVADMRKLVASDKNVRVIYREVPILAPTSRDAALWALAAAKQGKHKAFHDAMFAGDKPDAQSILIAARKAGLNIDEAKKFAISDAASAEVDSNLAMMQQVGFSGTPTFVVGEHVLEGAVGYDALKAAVEKVRKQT